MVRRDLSNLRNNGLLDDGTCRESRNFNVDAARTTVVAWALTRLWLVLRLPMKESRKKKASCERPKDDDDNDSEHVPAVAGFSANARGEATLHVHPTRSSLHPDPWKDCGKCMTPDCECNCLRTFLFPRCVLTWYSTPVDEGEAAVFRNFRCHYEIAIGVTFADGRRPKPLQ